MLATDFSPLRFSTGKLSERERLPIWCEEFGRALLRVDIEPLALPFYVEAELRALPDVHHQERFVSYAFPAHSSACI